MGERWREEGEKEGRGADCVRKGGFTPISDRRATRTLVPVWTISNSSLYLRVRHFCHVSYVWPRVTGTHRRSRLTATHAQSKGEHEVTSGKGPASSATGIRRFRK